METLLIAIGAGVAFIVAYHTYGRWLGRKIFNLTAGVVCPSHRLRDDQDYVPTKKSIVFGHHFTSIAGTGPIVGPAIAVIWGWVPALLWVVLGSIFIGAVHDFGALVVSLRNNGQTVGDIAGRVLNRRVRILFLIVLFLALTIVLAIFGLVIAAVFKAYPQAIFPCVVQIPLAIVIGIWLHRKGVNLLIPSLIALALMYVTVIYGNAGVLGAVNEWMASWPIIVWVGVLLVYSYVASVIPVWVLLQPRDYVNSLQLLTALALIVLGLCTAAFVGGAPPVEGAEAATLDIAAPAFRWDPHLAPMIFPFLFITIACGAISGFHCLVSSGTSSKQLEREPDARFVGFGSMLTEGFLAMLVILACVAGLGMGLQPDMQSIAISGGSSNQTANVQSADLSEYNAAVFRDQQGNAHTLLVGPDGERASYRLFDRGLEYDDAQKSYLIEKSDLAGAASPWPTNAPQYDSERGLWLGATATQARLVDVSAYNTQYYSWAAANALSKKVGAFVEGAGNFLTSLGLPWAVSVALMGVLVASFAGTTLDTACRLQRYVVQELASAIASGKALEGGKTRKPLFTEHRTAGNLANPLVWLQNKHGATVFAIVVAGFIAAMPQPGAAWSLATAGTGGMILWPMFGATNQLLAGLAFMVVAFWLWRRQKPIWFLVLPLVFMLIMPAWAMLMQLPQWLSPGEQQSPNWPLIVIAVATLLLEVWMIIEALLLWPKVKGVMEQRLPGAEPDAAAEAQPAYATADA